MAKKTAAKAVAPTSLEIRYNLRDLPSAQHKAGLAGLLLLIENMGERKQAGLLKPEIEIPEVVAKSATTATIRFTERSAQDLFDDLYNANPVERYTDKWPKDKKGKPTREVPEEATNVRGKKSIKNRYYYNDAEPFSHFLDNYMSNENQVWHKLWRDMIYAIPRNRSTTHIPFETRAKGLPVKEGAEAWKGLLAAENSRGKDTPATVELSGSLMLAIQKFSAEKIPFKDHCESQLLLHFWPLAARVFVPQQIITGGKDIGKPTFVGYTLAIPESPISASTAAITRAYLPISTRPGSAVGRGTRSSPSPSRVRWSFSKTSIAWLPSASSRSGRRDTSPASNSFTWSSPARTSSSGHTDGSPLKVDCSPSTRRSDAIFTIPSSSPAACVPCSAIDPGFTNSPPPCTNASGHSSSTSHRNAAALRRR
jgi:hypothetical protein